MVSRMIARSRDRIRSLPSFRAISLPFVIAAAALFFLILPQTSGRIAMAQSGKPAIHGLLPVPPHCAFKRTSAPQFVTILGRNLSAGGGWSVQFRRKDTGETTELFRLFEVERGASDQVRLDVSRMSDRLWPNQSVLAQARIVAADGQPITNWSGSVALAADEAGCASLGRGRIAVPSEPLVRGQPGDYWADVIIGKPDFTQMSVGDVVPFKVFNPGGVAVDRSVYPGLAYVWDGVNSRIIGIDLAKCYAQESPCHADLVLGQPSLYDHGACNGDNGEQQYPFRAPASASTLCGIPDLAFSPGETKSFVAMTVDATGNLYTPDSFNNRVLFYERPFEEDGVADAVWGQADFSGLNCNHGDYDHPTPQTLCFHSKGNHDRTPAKGGWPGSGVELDTVGNLWVADSGNNRVLRFPFDRTTRLPATTADLVLGQPDPYSRARGDGLRNLFAPAALRFGPKGRLYVSDTYNNRVVVFNPPFSSGMAASGTFGHSFRSPHGLEIDPELRGLWVNDYASSMVSLWNWEGDRVLKVVGKATYNVKEGWLHFQEVPGAPRFGEAGGGFAFDGRGNLLVALTGHEQDVLRFPSPLPDLDSGAVSRPDKRFFYPPGAPNFTGIQGLRFGDGVALFQDQLIVRMPVA